MRKGYFMKIKKLRFAFLKSFVKAKSFFGGACVKLNNNRGDALSYVLITVAGVIIGGLIVYPKSRDFAKTIFTKLNAWWLSIEDNIFETNP